MSVYNQERIRASREAIKDIRDKIDRKNEGICSVGEEIQKLKLAGASCQTCALRKRMKLMDFCTKGKIIKPVKLYNICTFFKEKEQND